ncbi:MAG: 6-phosphogluconolactonase [Steroidobacteraceae bacterium]
MTTIGSGYAGAQGPSVRAHCFADRAELIAALANRLERALESAGAGTGPGASFAPPSSAGAGAVQDADAGASVAAGVTASVDAGAGAGTSPGAAVMLSGGSTPIPAYQALAKRGVQAGAGLVLFYSDDRYVPSDSDASNYHQTRPLVDALALPADRVLRVRTELPLAAAAADYEQRLAALMSGHLRFTLGLLGLGADGHTASLFGAPDIARAEGRHAISVHRPDGRDAVSVTPAVLARIEELVFVVAGAEKRTALAALLERRPELTAWRAVSGCKAIEVWAEPEAWPGGSGGA